MPRIVRTNWKNLGPVADILERHYGSPLPWEERLGALNDPNIATRHRLLEQFGRTIGDPNVEGRFANVNPLLESLGILSPEVKAIDALDQRRRAYQWLRLQRNRAQVNPRLRALADEMRDFGFPNKTTVGQVAPELGVSRSGTDISQVPIDFRTTSSGTYYKPTPNPKIIIDPQEMLADASKYGVDPAYPLATSILHEAAHALREARRGMPERVDSYFQDIPELTARAAETGLLGKFLRGSKTPLWAGAAVAGGALGMQAAQPDESEAGLTEEAIRLAARLMHEGKIPPQLDKMFGDLTPAAHDILKNPSLAQRLYIKALAGDTRPDLDIGNPHLKEVLREGIEGLEQRGEIHTADPTGQGYGHAYVHPRVVRQFPDRRTRVLTGTARGDVGDVPKGRPSLIDIFPEVGEALDAGRLRRHSELPLNYKLESERADLYNSLGTGYYSFRDPQGRLFVSDLYDFTKEYEHEGTSTLQALRDFIHDTRHSRATPDRPIGDIDVNLQTIGNRVAKPFGIKWPLFAGAAGAGLGMMAAQPDQAQAGIPEKAAELARRGIPDRSTALTNQIGEITVALRHLEDRMAISQARGDDAGANEIRPTLEWLRTLAVELLRKRSKELLNYSVPAGVAGAAMMSPMQADAQIWGPPRPTLANRELGPGARRQFQPQGTAGQDVNELLGYGAQALEPVNQMFGQVTEPVNQLYEGLTTGSEALGRRLGGESGALLGRQAGEAATWFDPTSISWLERMRLARAAAAIGANRALVP